MTANDAINAPPKRLCGQRALILTDEVDGILDLQLRPLRQRPICQSQQTPDCVEVGIEPDGEVVGVIA